MQKSTATFFLITETLITSIVTEEFLTNSQKNNDILQ